MSMPGAVAAHAGAQFAHELIEPSLGSQVGHLARRSVARTFRQPGVVLPTLLFPLFFLAINASGLSSSQEIFGFPTDSYLTFALATTFVQSGMTSVMNAGMALAEDVQSGFLTRLSLTPMRGTALLFGHVAGSVALGGVAALLFMGTGLAAGASVKTGVEGAIVVIMLATVIVLTFASFGVFVAIATGRPEAVQLTFPLLFVLLFLSSMAIPRNLITHDWFRFIAGWNPMSYFIEAIRAPLIIGWDAPSLARGLVLVIGVTMFSLVGGSRLLRKRILRT